jgi:signal peptidase I
MQHLTHRRRLSVNTIHPLPQRPRRLLVDLLRVSIYALIILTLSSTILVRYEIEQTSMEPNFHPGQRVFVSQFGRTYGNLFGGSAYAAHPGSTAANGLQRGQIVVFYRSEDQKDTPLIKRLIGMPGDHVAIHDGAVFINNTRLVEPYLSTTTDCSAHCNLTLGDDEYFFLGDNRAVSHDSRQLGPIPGEQVIGRVVMRFWPLNQFSFFP